MQLFKRYIPSSNTISFAIVFPVGAINEPTDLNGITHLIEHLSFKKTSALTQTQIYDICESNGVNIYARTTQNSIEYHFVCRKNVFSTIVSLLADMLHCCDYGEAEISTEKNIVLNECIQRENTNSEEIIKNRWINKSYQNEILGSAKTLSNITAKHILDYKKSILSSDFLIILLGNYAEDDVCLVEKLFSFTKKDRILNTARYNQETRNKVINFVKDRYDTVDVYYCFHHKFSTENKEREIVCLHAIENILMRGDKAYVTEFVKDQNNILYGIDSKLVVQKNEAVWTFWFSVHKDSVLKAIDLIDGRIKSCIIDNEYFKYHKAFFCDNVIMLQDDMHLLKERVVDLYTQFNRVVSPEEYSAMILETPLEDYNIMFKKLIKSKQLYVFGNVNRKTKNKLESLKNNNK